MTKPHQVIPPLTTTLLACLAFNSLTGAEPKDHAEEDLPAKSFIPEKDVEQFVVDKLDLTTFWSSLSHPPAKDWGKRHLKDYGIAATEITKNRIECETDDWYYIFEIVRRGDENGDGIEDLVIRFDDDAKQGTYLTADTFLFTRFSEDSNLIALAYRPKDAYMYPARD